MRHSYSTVTPAVVRAAAAAGLRTALPWQPFRASVTVAALLDLLLLAAAWRSSLSAVVRCCRFGFCHETARRALDANLPPPERLADGLVNALHAYLPRPVRRRAWDLALDLHYVPFYGSARTPGVLGGPKKGGTNRFFVYATAAVVQRGQRWCLGLVPVRDTHWEKAVAPLIGQLQARAVRVRALVLDRGFFSGHVIRALQERRVPFVIGVPRKGGPANRAQRLFALPSGQVVRYAWETGRGSRPVAVSMTAARRRVRGRWRCEVYAFAGVPAEGAVRRSQRARLLRQLSQRRFGIETSYRQMNQGKGRTTSPEPRRRLLWLGLALLLRQVWVWLQQRLAPRGTNWRHWRPPPQLRLAILLDWLATWMRQHYPAPRVIRAPQPLELPVAATVNR